MSKQETLEEVAERFYPTIKLDWLISEPTRERAAFIQGAKWKSERSYSEEDMAESFMACWKANVLEGFECKLSFNEWFEQFKKK